MSVNRSKKLSDLSPDHLFEHYCHCGKWASFGYNVFLLQGRKGDWYCRMHRPQAKEVPISGFSDEDLTDEQLIETIQEKIEQTPDVAESEQMSLF